MMPYGHLDVKVLLPQQGGMKIRIRRQPKCTNQVLNCKHNGSGLSSGSVAFPLRRSSVMTFSVPEFTSRNSEDSASWPSRVLENIRAALSMTHTSFHAASGTPAPFPSVETSTRYGSAQSISAF